MTEKELEVLKQAGELTQRPAQKRVSTESKVKDRLECVSVGFGKLTAHLTEGDEGEALINIVSNETGEGLATINESGYEAISLLANHLSH